MRYVDALQGVMRDMHKRMMALVTPDLKELTGQGHTDGHTWLSSVFEVETGKMVAEVSDLVGGMFDRHARAVMADNAKKLSVIGIKSTDLRIGPELAKRRSENVRLVEKAGRAYADSVKEIFEAPDVNGMRVEDLQAKLEARGNVSESRAALIARDQTLKLNGAITQMRQENAGVSRYTWSTSLDERVRPEHVALEGQVFDWNSPPAVGHPGQDYQCRCIAVPVLDELAELDKPEVAETPPAPAPEPLKEPAVAPSPSTLLGNDHIGFIDRDPSISEEAQTALVRSISDDHTREFLEHFPLNKLSIETGFMATLPDGTTAAVDGQYIPRQTTIRVAMNRASWQPGQTMIPGFTWRIADTMPTREEASQSDLRHELGHHVHMLDGRNSAVDKIVTEAFARATAANQFLTRYGRQDRREYFAEAYCAYYSPHADLLKRVDPNGYAMVEAVLKQRGVPLR